MIHRTVTARRAIARAIGCAIDTARDRARNIDPVLDRARDIDPATAPAGARGSARALAPVAALLAILIVAQPQALAGELLDVGSVAPSRRDQVAIAARDGDGFTGFAFGPATADRATVAFPLPGAPVDVGPVAGLRWHVQNAMAWPVTVDLALADDRGGRLAWRVGLQPGPPVTLALPLAATSPRAAAPA